MNGIQKNLVYDVGMHLAQDTTYYLSTGYDVIAIDAFPEMIQHATDKFPDALKNGKLRLLNYALTDNDNEIITFHISGKTEWNSINENISTRQNQKASSIQVPTIKLSSLFKQYGVPYYCKIDVEGFDNICIQTLQEMEEKPTYISCETECFSESQIVNEDDILATLNSLKSLGYTKFKLIEQDFLSPLLPGKSFYLNPKKESIFFKGIRKVLRPFNYQLTKMNNRELLEVRQGYNFPFGATGPFGENLGGNWMDYKTAKNTLLFHRKEFFSRAANTLIYTIWCDWHATH